MRDWRQSVKLGLFLVVVEGAIRKWFLPQISDYVYFLKDIIFLIAYCQYFSSRGKYIRFSEHPVLSFLFGLSAILILAEAFNSNLSSPLIGLFGSRSYLIYLPLYFLVGDLFSTQQELKHYLQRYLLIAFPVCLLGIAQFFAPPNSIINTYAPSAATTSAIADVATFGDDNHARITGTFPYLAGLGTYISVWVLVGIAVWLNTTNRKWQWTLVGAISLFFVCLLMTGSRGPVFTTVAAILSFAVLGLNGRTNKERRSVLALAGISVCLVVGISLLPSASGAFVERASKAGDNPAARFFAAYWEPFDYVEEAGFIGFGAGVTQGGSDALRNALRLPPPLESPLPFENESTRVLMELGPIGFLTWYAIRFALLCLLWTTYRRLRTPFLRQVALVAFLIHLLWFGGQLVLNTTAGVYYWFLAGFIILLPRLEKQEWYQAQYYGQSTL